MEPTDIQKVETAPLATRQSATDIMSLMQTAVEKGQEPAQLRELFELYKSVEDREREKAFAAAMANFQAGCPPIPKNRSSKKTTASSAKFSFTYADTEAIVKVIRPEAYKHGLSFRWKGRGIQQDGKDFIEETCIIRHVDGHTEESSSVMPVDMSFGGSPAHKYESAAAYARRQSLVDAFGLVTSEVEQAPGDPGPVITTEQHNIIGELIKDAQADTAVFLDYFNIKDIKDLRQSQFAQAERMLCDKLAHQKRKDSKDGD